MKYLGLCFVGICFQGGLMEKSDYQGNFHSNYWLSWNSKSVFPSYRITFPLFWIESLFYKVVTLIIYLRKEYFLALKLQSRNFKVGCALCFSLFLEFKYISLSLSHGLIRRKEMLLFIVFFWISICINNIINFFKNFTI